MKKTLFVADDNQLDLRILKLLLLRNPIFSRELFFNDGSSMVNYVRSNYHDKVNLPDVIFLEINLPGKDGWKALESLKAVYEYLSKPIAVYIISSTINANDIEKALSYDFVKEFIPKPIYRDKIVEIAQEAGSYQNGY